MAKIKGQKDKQRYTKHTYKTRLINIRAIPIFVDSKNQPTKFRIPRILLIVIVCIAYSIWSSKLRSYENTFLAQCTEIGIREIEYIHGMCCHWLPLWLSRVVCHQIYNNIKTISSCTMLDFKTVVTTSVRLQMQLALPSRQYTW